MKSIGNPVIQGLPDLCADILSFTLQLRKSEDPGDPEALRRDVEELFRLLEERAREAEIPEANVSQAKYALAALVDELILTSNWQAKESWSGRPLQLEYFNDFAAGEEFYNKLETLRRVQDPGKLDVLEVYYLCLTLGFKGKYADIKGMETLRSLTKGIAAELLAARGRDPSSGGTLSPRWERPDELPHIVKSFPVWGIVAACIGALLLVYILFAAILSGVAEGVLQSLG